MIDAATIKALVGGGGGALVPVVIMYTLFTPQDDFYRHVADSKTGTVLELVSRARSADGDYKETLCRALIETLNEVCNDAPEHPLCVDRGQYMNQAGCG